MRDQMGVVRTLILRSSSMPCSVLLLAGCLATAGLAQNPVAPAPSAPTSPSVPSGPITTPAAPAQTAPLAQPKLPVEAPPTTRTAQPAPKTLELTDFQQFTAQ